MFKRKDQHHHQPALYTVITANSPQQQRTLNRVQATGSLKQMSLYWFVICIWQLYALGYMPPDVSEAMHICTMHNRGGHRGLPPYFFFRLESSRNIGGRSWQYDQGVATSVQKGLRANIPQHGLNNFIPRLPFWRRFLKPLNAWKSSNTACLPFPAVRIQT